MKMSSKDKELSKSKFKLFLKNKSVPAGGGGSVSSNVAGAINSYESFLRLDVERDLRPEQPLAQRCKLLKEFADLQLDSLKLDEYCITRLWDLTKDIIIPHRPPECRQTALYFYKKLIHSQYKNLTLLREHFFLVIQNHEVPEDLCFRLELLDTLTENGRDINNFEEKIGKFMLQWFPAIIDAKLLRPYLDILVNLIKFNAAHLDTDVVVGIVHNACHLSCAVIEDEIGLQCLTILEMVMCYTIFPSEPLLQCVVTLCRTVNHAPYCQASWKIMRNLLGTQLGYHSMQMMCNILNDRNLFDDQQLLRGAVFHLNMNIFGSNLVFQGSPMFYATTVLTSFLTALESRQNIVTFEVILSVRKVIKQYKTNLPVIIWDRICDIMAAIIDNIEYYKSINIATERLENLNENFHENIDCIEKLLQNERSNMLVNADRIYNLIERVSDSRPEHSVLQLIEYRCSKITPTRPEWLRVLNDYVRHYYRMPSVNVRIKTIQSLMRVMELNRFSYEEEILERVAIPLFSNVMNESDVKIRLAVTNALIEFAYHCDTKRCGELLDIIEQIINKPYEQHSHTSMPANVDQELNDNSIKGEIEIMDIIAAVEGLIDIFAVKVYRLPSSHAIKIFNILIGHLEQHYEKPKVFEQVCVVRFKIFQWILRARANASFHIGYPDPSKNGAIKFSHFLGIDSNLPYESDTLTATTTTITHTQPQQHHNHNVAILSMRRVWKIIIKCLECLQDNKIFRLVIKELPRVLHNKALIQGLDVESLAAVLFKICKHNDEAFVLPVIASLVIYNQQIQLIHQYIILPITKGFISSVANICINAMTTMILEMPKALMRSLPDILFQMSKMSDTTIVSVPVLEFLSILSRLSNDLFTNFIPRHYKYVFAISLPYTKPHRYDHYTVSLAHHVIAGWFLKCKLELRKSFVSYIISSIQSNASMLYDDIKSRNLRSQDYNSLNEDSSNRKRSTSLTERGSRKARSAESDMRPLLNDSLKNFHAELAETCIDFFARHTFSPCAALPKRVPAVEYLLRDGCSETWLVGHNLITIATSGCPFAPNRHGLCDRCAQLGRAAPLSSEMNLTTHATSATEKRYAKVSSEHSTGNESAANTELISASGIAISSSTPQRQTSNSSTTSLEALSRRGSNSSTAVQLNTDACTTSSNTSPVQQSICVRACTAWAEIMVRRPTGNISWITRIQNPIANDCFGHELPFSNIVALFMPTLNGGIFGPDFAAHEEDTLPMSIIQQPTNLLSTQVKVACGSSSSHESLSSSSHQRQEDTTRNTDNAPKVKERSLQRQEEINSTNTHVSAAIDIPKPASSNKRGKDALSGSVSDGEVDDDNLNFEDENGKGRNPVRRVNSSPEMSSSWRYCLLAAKPLPLSQNISRETEMQMHKKKNSQYIKDARVSCEAIPEEKAGSPPPRAGIITTRTNNAPNIVTVVPRAITKMLDTNIPRKQLSSDTVTSTNAQPGQSSVALSPRLEPKRTLLNTSGTNVAKSSSGEGVLITTPQKVDIESSQRSDYSGGGIGQDVMRGRSKTISVVREVNGKARPQAPTFRSFGAAKAPPLNAKLCLNPSFIFMQLFHTGQLSVTDTPFKVPAEEVKVLTLVDLVPPFETHNIGVLYVGKGQCNNAVEILRNSHGSLRYIEFLRNIGTLVSLKDVEQQKNLFVGSLDKTGADGKFTYVWKDDIVQVTFHVATLMPNNLKKDPNCNEKKKHIGNDHVSIVYNESGQDYNLNTITGQCNYACVIIEPIELNTNRLYVKARPEISKVVCHSEPKIVSDASAPILARQLALHANMASRVYHSLQARNATPYASNWVERLRHIKRLRTKLIENKNLQQQQQQQKEHQQQDLKLEEASSSAYKNQIVGDFTQFT